MANAQSHLFNALLPVRQMLIATSLPVAKIPNASMANAPSQPIQVALPTVHNTHIVKYLVVAQGLFAIRFSIFASSHRQNAPAHAAIQPIAISRPAIKIHTAILFAANALFHPIHALSFATQMMIAISRPASKIPIAIQLDSAQHRLQNAPTAALAIIIVP
jgi:hypothetical protein